MINVGIIGWGAYLPPKVLTNHDFVSMGLDTSDDWVFSRTGISERRVAEKGVATSDLAYAAAVSTIKSSGKTVSDIDAIIVATSTPDYTAFPSTACVLQKKLGLSSGFCFDIAAACTGFNYAFTTGVQYIQNKFCKTILVVAADCLSRLLNWEDRGTCVLFGDGAGAVVLSEVSEGYGILASSLHSNGEYADLLKVPSGGSLNPMTLDALNLKENTIVMDGKSVFKLAVHVLVESVQDTLVKAHLSTRDINYFIPHQANSRIIEYACEKLNLPAERSLLTLNKYGNTSAASIPITLSENAHRFKKGDIIVFSGFGSGFTWGTSVIRWGA